MLRAVRIVHRSIRTSMLLSVIARHSFSLCSIFSRSFVLSMLLLNNINSYEARYYIYQRLLIYIRWCASQKSSPERKYNGRKSDSWLYDGIHKTLMIILHFHAHEAHVNSTIRMRTRCEPFNFFYSVYIKVPAIVQITSNAWVIWHRTRSNPVVYRRRSIKGVRFDQSLIYSVRYFQYYYYFHL